MTRVLVTGAGGYIGSVLVGAVLAQGHAVTAVDRFFFGEESLSPLFGPNLRVVKRDARDVDDRLLDGVETVYDLAAFSNDPAGELDPALTYAVNWKSRARLAGLARDCGVQRYVLSSSCSVYGRGGTDELTEEAPVAPVSVYAESNVRAERDVLALHRPGFSVTVLRNPTVYGLSRRMRFDLVVNLMTLNATKRGRIFVTGGGRQWRPVGHIRDVVDAFLAVAAAPEATVGGEIFNVHAENVQVRSLAYAVREALPFPVEVDIVPDDADRRDYRVSFNKWSDRLGARSARSVRDGVQEIYGALKSGTVDDGPMTSTVAWYRTILEAKRLLTRIELDGRLL